MSKRLGSFAKVKWWEKKFKKTVKDKYKEKKRGENQEDCVRPVFVSVLSTLVAFCKSRTNPQQNILSRYFVLENAWMHFCASSTAFFAQIYVGFKNVRSLDLFFREKFQPDQQQNFFSRKINVFVEKIYFYRKKDVFLSIPWFLTFERIC